jgi:hypothetical protein
MYNSSSKRTALMVALAVIAATGCGGSGAGAPIGASAPVAATGLGTMATTLNVSGGYAGNVTDSIFGTGRIYGDLAQYQNSVGGTLTFEYGSTVFITPATFLLKGKSLTGSGAIGKVTGGVCEASETATYASHGLTGSYTVERGCANDNGTFTMKQTCLYPRGATVPNFALKSC